jgi:hypothetical protein
MIQINVNNNDSDDDFVTIVDNNTSPPSVVLNSLRLNKASNPVQVNIQEDGNGKGNVTWTAVRANDPNTSKTDSATPANLDTVNVSAT